MTTNNRIVLSSDHAGVALRQAVAAHVGLRGWVAVDRAAPRARTIPGMAKRRRGPRRVRRLPVWLRSVSLEMDH